VRDRLAAASAAGLLAALGHVPFPVALRMGAALGGSWARLAGPRTRDALINLRIAFPEWREVERRRVLLRAFENMGRSLAEFAWIGRWSEAELRGRVGIRGREHLDAALAASGGRGIVVLTGHFGSFELLAAAMVAHGFPVAVVHRSRENPLLDELLSQRRMAGGAKLFARGNAARGVLRALREGRFLALPYDQNCRRREGVFVPFFGRLACARAAPPRIAMKSGAPVLPVFLHRQADPLQHEAVVRPAVEMVSTGDLAADLRENARRMTEALESEIRAAPEQWVWVHRRWRTQPPGEPRPYPGNRWR